LKVPNAQLRCSLLTKMGYDKLIEKVKPRVKEETFSPAIQPNSMGKAVVF